MSLEHALVALVMKKRIVPFVSKETGERVLQTRSFDLFIVLGALEVETISLQARRDELSLVHWI